MKRNHLIPREKSKKVIYLDPRGRGVGEKHYGARALYVLAVLCLLYCVGTVSYTHLTLPTTPYV